jgi:hypothetical protein
MASCLYYHNYRLINADVVNELTNQNTVSVFSHNLLVVVIVIKFMVDRKGN